MGLDSNKKPLLYSVGTQLAYKIERNYYNDIHYVWCTTDFNDLRQPPTSNPSKICKRYLELISTGDRHAVEINNNISGILRGAKAKYDSRVISKKEYNKIKTLVSAARYDAFYPVIYIIQSDKVKDRCIEVTAADRASDSAVEYRIEDMKPGEFEIVFAKDFLDGILKVVDKEAGE